MRLLVRDRGFYRQFLRLALSIALQNVIIFSVGLADNVMLGAYSEEALSGVALCNQIQFLLQMLITGVAEAVVVIASQYWGKGDVAAVRRILSIGLRVALVAGGLLFGVVFCFPAECLGLFTDETAVIAEGVRYLRVICFSYLFFSATTCLVNSLRSVETVRIGFVVPLVTLVINVCLNYVLIYGNLGAPRLGAKGAAIATLTARVVELVVVVCYLAFFEKKLHLSFRSFLQWDRGLFRDFLRVGMPVILANAMWGIGMAVQTGILGHLGGDVIAANSIATIVFQVLSVVSYGMASAAAVITGKTVGEGRVEEVKQYAVTMQVLFLGIGVVTGLALFCVRDGILRLYAISPETKALASQLMAVLSVTICGTAYEVGALTGIVRGGGDTTFVLLNDLIFIWVIVIPSSLAAAFWLKLPPVWVFLCLKSDQILKCFVAVVKVNRFGWIRRLTRESDAVTAQE